MQAEGVPQGEELAVLEPLVDQGLPPEILTEPAVCAAGQRRDASLTAATCARPRRLLDEAGWAVGDDGMRRNAKGETLTVEFIDDSPVLRAVINPYVENLRAIGVDAKFTLVDAAQMQQRHAQDFDFDIVPGRFAMSFSPSIELRQFFTTRNPPTAKGSPNLSGIADPGGGCADRDGDRSRRPARSWTRGRKALDRVLRQKRYLGAATGTSGKYLVAYWDMFGTPASMPPYARAMSTSGGTTQRKARSAACQEQRRRSCAEMGAYILRRLAADHPDAVRDHGHQLRPDPVRARRPDRAGSRPAGRRRRCASRPSRAAAMPGRRRTSAGGGRRALHRRRAGLPPEFIAELEKQFGFDKPPLAALPRS